jgi:hypothetical protein
MTQLSKSAAGAPMRPPECEKPEAEEKLRPRPSDGSGEVVQNDEAAQRAQPEIKVHGSAAVPANELL